MVQNTMQGFALHCVEHKKYSIFSECFVIKCKNTTQRSMRMEAKSIQALLCIAMSINMTTQHNTTPCIILWTSLYKLVTSLWNHNKPLGKEGIKFIGLTNKTWELKSLTILKTIAIITLYTYVVWYDTCTLTHYHTAYQCECVAVCPHRGRGELAHTGAGSD